MPTVEELNPQPMIDWMRERQKIYRKRQAGHPRPYTEDYAMSHYRFCNVFRELDKVTMWIRDNWRTPYAHHPKLPFAMAVARYFNHPATLAEIGFPETWNPEELNARLEARSYKEKTFSPAYIISPGGSTKPKIERVIFDYLTPIWEESEKWIVPNSIEKTWKNISRHDGFGAFIAYEVVSDLRHTPLLRKSPDAYTWANPGPGACRGLQRLLGKTGKDVRRSLPPAFMLASMRHLLIVCKQALAGEDIRFTSLEMRDIEHSLCETDKWLRVATGEGSPKERFLA
jgi:hypothetical protein